jgi:chemotaxis protein methyltransferase CheR
MDKNQILIFFANYIEKEMGIIYAEYNYFQLQNRLEQIATLLSLDSMEALYHHAQNGIIGDFRQQLLDLATNNETSFFRDCRIFEALEKILLAPVGNQKNQKNGMNLNIWSAASSSGQESLSIAILISEYNKRENKNISFNIFATDISERILIKAKKAQYSHLEVQRGLSPILLQKYFTKDDQNNWTANSELTSLIQYKKQNLIEDFHFSAKFDLVLCRNILIYQNLERKIEIIKKIWETLNDDGLLVLGSGESVIGLSEDFIQENVEGAVIYRKKEKKLLSA